MNKLKKVQDRLAKYFDPALGQYDLEDAKLNSEELSEEERYAISISP